MSDITANECKYLLGREPDGVTPNGFENDIVWTGAEFDAKRTEARRSMIAVAEACLGRKFASDPLIVGTSGRYEFRNRGSTSSSSRSSASPPRTASTARCSPISPCRPATAVRASTCRPIWPIRRSHRRRAAPSLLEPHCSRTRAWTRS